MPAFGLLNRLCYGFDEDLRPQSAEGDNGWQTISSLDNNFSGAISKLLLGKLLILKSFGNFGTIFSMLNTDSK